MQPFKVGDLVRVRAKLLTRRAGELAIITGTHNRSPRRRLPPSYTVKYISSGDSGWWYADQLENAEEQSDAGR